MHFCASCLSTSSYFLVSVVVNALIMYISRNFGKVYKYHQINACDLDGKIPFGNVPSSSSSSSSSSSPNKKVDY